jgi:type I restriction enzyme S subunit
LPDGWAETTLAQIAHWGSGGTPSRRDPAHFGGAIPWIKTGELGQRLISTTEETLSQLGLSRSSAKLFPAGAVAVAMYGATIGKTSMLGIRAATNQACAVAVPDFRITSSEYLYHFLCSQRDAFVVAGKGGAQPNISQSVLKAWPIPLPPLPEQKRIADKLDTLLARVDACRDRLDRIPAIVKCFRQSVLAAATSGELTREWREEQGIGGEWTKVRIGEIATLSSGFGFPPNLQGKESGELAFAKVSDISRAVLHAQGRLTTAANYIDESEAVRIKARPVAAGSTIFAKIGEGLKLNRRALAMTRLVLDNNCMAATPKFGRVRPEYLFLVFQTIDLSPFSVATAVPSVRRSDVESVELGLPSIQEQDEIIRRTTGLFEAISSLERVHRTAWAKVERVIPSVLAKAFRGELVPQDPNDEPAAALLARIAAARDDAGLSAGRARRRKTASTGRPA